MSEPVTDQDIRNMYPFGAVNVQIDDNVTPMTPEQYETWVAAQVYAANNPDA